MLLNLVKDPKIIEDIARRYLEEKRKSRKK